MLGCQPAGHGQGQGQDQVQRLYQGSDAIWRLLGRSTLMVRATEASRCAQDSGRLTVAMSPLSAKQVARFVSPQWQRKKTRWCFAPWCCTSNSRWPHKEGQWKEMRFQPHQHGVLLSSGSQGVWRAGGFFLPSSGEGKFVQGNFFLYVC